MSELKKVIIVSAEEDDISVKLQVASEDYSAIYDIIHWEADAYMAGFNKISALFLGVFPPLIMILFSYFFCIVNLVKQYNNNYLCE